LVAASSCGVPHSDREPTRALTATTVAPTTTVPPPTTSPPTTVIVHASRSLARPRPAVVSVADDAFWRRVADCESPTNQRSRNGKYGGYFQMTQQAWHGGGGDGVPESHTYDEQLAVAKRWAAMTNPWRQWPVCWPRAARGG
jgi:hypothetical protein